MLQFLLPVRQMITNLSIFPKNVSWKVTLMIQMFHLPVHAMACQKEVAPSTCLNSSETSPPSGSPAFPTWTGKGFMWILNWFQKLGIRCSYITSIMMRSLVGSSMGGISPFPVNLYQKMQLGIIPVHFSMEMISINMWRKSYSLVPWWARSQTTFHSKLSAVHLAQCLNQKQSPPGLSQIVPNTTPGLTTGLILTFTEAKSGTCIFPLVRTSFKTSAESEGRTLERKFCSSRLICQDITDSLFFAPAKVCISVFNGVGKDILTVPVHLATEVPVCVHSVHQMQLPGYSGLRWNPGLVFPTLAGSVAVKMIVIAVILSADHMLTIFPLLLQQMSLTTCSECFWPSSKLWVCKLQRLPETLFLQLRLPLFSAFNTTWSTIPFRCLQRSWPTQSLSFTHGWRRIKLQRESSKASLESSSIAPEWFLLVVSFLAVCSTLREEQLALMLQFHLTITSDWIVSGGTRTSTNGMVYQFWSSALLELLGWMLARMGLTENQPLVLSTLCLTSGSKLLSPNQWKIGISAIWNCSPTLWWQEFGVSSGQACVSLVTQIVRLLRSSCPPGDQSWTEGWSWEESSGHCSTDSSSLGNRFTFPGLKMFCQMQLPGGLLLQNRDCFGSTAACWGLVRKNQLFNQSISSGINSNVPGMQTRTHHTESPPVSDLHNMAARFQESAWAESTKTSKKSEVRAFMAFCIQYGINLLPVSGDDLVLYCCWLVATGRIKCHGSLRQYLSAVSTHHKRLGLTCPTPSQYGPLLFTVNGIKRELATPSRRSLPITIKMLTNLLNTRIVNCSENSKTLLEIMKSLCVILFFSMVRSSSLIPPSPGAMDPLRQLVWGRVKRTCSGLSFNVFLEKTIQFKERVHVVTLAARPGSIFCPVAAMDKILNLRGRKNCRPEDLVFQCPGDNGCWRPLVKYQFQRWFDHRLVEMGVNSDLFKIHGFRHGGVSFAAECEESLTMVKVASGHMSECVWTYLNIPEESRYRVSKKMLAALPPL